jgi:hypothetical protein
MQNGLAVDAHNSNVVNFLKSYPPTWVLHCAILAQFSSNLLSHVQNGCQQLLTSYVFLVRPNKNENSSFRVASLSPRIEFNMTTVAIWPLWLYDHLRKKIATRWICCPIGQTSILYCPALDWDRINCTWNILV